MILPITQPPPLQITTTHHHHHHHRLLHHLNHCTSISQLKQIHAQIIRTTISNDPHTLFLHTRILHFSSLHDLNYAFQLFPQFQNPNSFIWNNLIRGCARSSNRKFEAITLYKTMLCESTIIPDKHTFPFVLKACAYLFAISEGKQIHSHVLKLGFGSDVYINNSLIHLYASCGCMEDAREVFDKMPERSVVSWNAMIDGLVQLGEFNDALELFRRMQLLFEPDGYAIQSVLRACAGLGALSLGMWVHAHVLRRRDFCSDVLVNNCLLEMYFKCGSPEIARQVFKKMKNRNVTSWNIMIHGLACNNGDIALTYFNQMVQEQIPPNSITFSGILSACNHKGLVEQGRKYFNIMILDYKIQPVLEHYGCLIDLLARAGLISEALDLVSTMPIKPDAVIWRSLLDASCKKDELVELSEEAAEQIIELEQGSYSGAYVLLSRVYAAANRWNEVGLVRKIMTSKGVIKEPGCSSVEIDGVAHEFFAGDTLHPQIKEIYCLLDTGSADSDI